MDLKPTLEKLYPEGYLGGQCFGFLHLLTSGFPSVGPNLQDKINLVKNYGIPIDLFNKNFRPGDIVVTNESTKNGHGVMVNRLAGASLRVTESNYHLDGKVTHTRLLAASDSHIIGVLRVESFKFAFPPVPFPIQIPVSIIMNNHSQTDWNTTILRRMGEMQTWFWENSEHRIELIINNPKWVSLKGWDTVFTSGGFGYPFVEIVKEEWFDKNVLPLADPGAKIVCFVMNPKDWKGGVFNQPNLIELGYSYEPHFPIKLFGSIDPSDGDKYPPAIPGVFGLSKWICHEIVHGLYGIALKPSSPPGSDFTHLHFYPPGVFTDVLNDFDSGALDSIINN